MDGVGMQNNVPMQAMMAPGMMPQVCGQTKCQCSLSGIADFHTRAS